jgi:hypothetical protein
MEPVSRLREARFGGRSKVGKDHAQKKQTMIPKSGTGLEKARSEAITLLARRTT